jgi:two-component system sensor histidine kinase TctE
VSAINHLIHNLNEAHKAQQAFLTIAAHQLKTPIAGLQTQMELAIEEAPPSLIPRMEKMLAATRYLGHFVHQMLSLARSSPEADLSDEFSMVDLAEICEAAASGFLDTALQKNIDLGFEAAHAQVLGSPWLLRELLTNLIDNAIRYSPEGSRITCRCGINSDQQAFLEVEDNGVGIPESLQDKIFERFYRIDAVGKSGTGLGLSIVKEVAERHGASVMIITPASGKGLCFSVVFPIASTN